MGLIIPKYESMSGLVVENAYGKVCRIFGGKQEGWGCVFHIYASKEAADNFKPPVDEFNFCAQYNPDNMNAYEIIYTKAKEDKKLPNSIDY